MVGSRAGSRVVFAAAAALITACGGDRVTVSNDQAQPSASRSAAVLAISFEGPPKLMRVRPDTLARVSRAVPLGGGAGLAVISPDGSTLVLGSWQTPTLRFVDVRRMRRLGGWHRLDAQGALTAIAWPRRDRLLAVLQSQSGADVAVVNPHNRNVLSVSPLGGAISAFRQSGRLLVFVVAPPNRIGPARLAVVGADGEVRSVRLPNVEAGGERFDDGTDTPAFRERRPGLAVDGRRARAYVVPPGDRVVEVDLATLAVREHETATRISLLGRLRDWLEPTAQAKSIIGPSRHATWFAGRLVVAGIDYHGFEGGRLRATTLGVKSIDTEDWSVETLDAAASAFSIVAGRLLLYGGPYDSRTGVGLDAYDQSGRRVFALFGDRHVGYVQTAGRYAYVSSENSTRHEIVDVVSGRVIRTVRTRGPLTLLRR